MWAAQQSLSTGNRRRSSDEYITMRPPKLAFLMVIAGVGIAGPAHAAELRLLPADTTLVGPHAQQRLIVVAEDAGKVVGERTAQASFASSNPAVVSVDKTGTVRAAGDGEAVITATQDGKQATARVKVTKAKESYTWSF